MIELAYLRAFIAWEVFLEEVFVLYMLGMKAPAKAAPVRFAFPPTRRDAKEWLRPEGGRRYVTWDASSVRQRARRYFRGGGPFDSVLRTEQNLLDQAKTIRNAIAHESDEARSTFETLARDKLGGALPVGLTPGGFLNTTAPDSIPAQTFLEVYLDKIEFMANRIVPI